MRRFPVRKVACELTVLLWLAAVTMSAVAQEAIDLTLRQRVLRQPGDDRWHTVTEPAQWQADQTAIVVCDMWDKHWCPTATARVGEMAPVMNRVLKAARRRGVLIIHCPSGTMDHYAGTPQRERAQSAPVVKTRVPLQNWCPLDSRVEGERLPIDDTDGGCDCQPAVESYRAWTCQHPAIRIEAADAVTDSAEAFYLMKQRGITNVIVMGVHTNMCVLGRPFSIRQMVAQGQNVVLMRDMTDTMYNPQREPFVSHFTGTDLVVEHIERHWCPTILSTDFLGGEEFRFAKDERPHVVVLCAEREYQTSKSLPRFAATHLGKDYRVSYVWDDADDRNHLPGADVVSTADLLLISVRRRTLPAEQLELVRRFVAAGRPVMGIRTASHAFSLRNQPAPAGRQAWPEFDAQVFGGHYTNHHGSGPETRITVAEDAARHSLLRDVDVSELTGRGSLYRVRPLADSTTPVLWGHIADQSPEPVAWLNHRSDGGTSFYTSLGHPADFTQPEFQQLLKNAVDLLTSGMTD
ncbi:MAG: ThuA domain-containing protein [Planctomycetaceae bacterium]|nr:ThuA domain-containing protein [Planctomycetaceae bacterium]